MRRIRWILLILVLGTLVSGCGNRSYKKGMEELKNGNYKEAAKQFEQSVKEDQNTADAYRGLGMALWEQEDYEGAGDAFKNAMDAGAKETGTLYNFLGNCELKLDNAEEALKYYEKGLKMEGNSDGLTQEMEYNSIVACEKMEDWDHVRTKLAEYVAKYPEDEEAAKEAEFLETR